MNLYDLSIGEDKMNQFLSIALKTHFESLKVSGKGENYWQCYQAFLNYCDIYGDCDLKDLFNNKLLRQDIVRACVLYYNSSAKAHRKEAVNRFLSAIDLFYKNYIKKMGGIECSALEGGCRNNEMIEAIEKCLNTKLKQEIYCPIDDKIEIEIIKICNNLKKSDFYKFGQKILCNLLLKYGFKLNLLVNLKKADVNDIDGIITIRNKDSVINLSVDKSMVSDIRQYNMVHRYPNREYFFLNTKGKKITSSSALATIQEKLEEVNNINTTTLAINNERDKYNDLQEREHFIPLYRKVYLAQRRKLKKILEKVKKRTIVIEPEPTPYEMKKYTKNTWKYKYDICGKWLQWSLGNQIVFGK